MESLIKGNHAILVHLQGEGLQMDYIILRAFLRASDKVSTGRFFNLQNNGYWMSMSIGCSLKRYENILLQIKSSVPERQ